MFDKDIFFIAKRWEAIVCSQVVASLIVYNFNEKNHTSRLGTIEIDERNFFFISSLTRHLLYTGQTHTNKNKFLTEISNGIC